MMKSALRGLLLFSLLTLVIGAAPEAGLAQGAFAAYTSGVQIANLENSTASITLTAYNFDGTINGTPLNDTIDASGSKTYFPISNVSSGFNGSIQVSSSTKVAAISNILSADFRAGASYVGRDTGSTTVRLPLLNKNNSGFNTWFSVQNTGSTDATVNVAYSDGSTATGTIKPGAAKVFNQATEPHTAAVFAATITSNQPLVAAVIQESTSVIFAYTGFSGAGSTAPLFPLVNANNSGYVTGLQIQNAGTQTTTVTVSYKASLFGADCTETQTIAPNDSKTFALAAFANSTLGSAEDCANAPTRFVGSAKVTANSANQPLIGIGNQLFPGRNGEAYGSFSAEEATSKVVLPLIMDRNNGFFTGFSVQNVGASATSVNCTFTNTDYTISANLEPEQALTDVQGTKIQASYVGGATCTADTGGKIVVVVNELGPNTEADQLLVYEGAFTD
ncbi:MAG: hypothetical protein R3E79_16150 [Caldilineaceae bacterium]